MAKPFVISTASGITHQEFTTTKAAQMTKEFIFFRMLPPELRLRIWRFATKKPRTIAITLRFTSSGRYCLVSRNMQCPITRTSTESRNVALMVRRPFYNDATLPAIYTDLEIDVLIYSMTNTTRPQKSLMHHFMRGRGQDIRYLAAPVDMFAYNQEFDDNSTLKLYMVGSLFNFKLKKLMLVEQHGTSTEYFKGMALNGNLMETNERGMTNLSLGYLPGDENLVDSMVERIDEVVLLVSKGSILFGGTWWNRYIFERPCRFQTPVFETSTV